MIEDEQQELERLAEKRREAKRKYRLVLLQAGTPLTEDQTKRWFRKIKAEHAHKLGRDKEARFLFKGRCPKLDNGYYACPGVCIKQKFVTKVIGCVSCTTAEVVAQTNFIFQHLPKRFPSLELTRVEIKPRSRKKRKAA